MIAAIARRTAVLRQIAHDRTGLALVEFALSLPLVLTLALTGAELTNYITVRMRISQLALHLADNAARVGVGGPREAKKVYESDIYDLMDGAQLQAGELDLYERGYVIVSSLEPMAGANPNNKARIRWQRCQGDIPYDSPYDDQTENLDGMGPTGRQAQVQPDGVTMFVQVYYQYEPLVSASLVPGIEITETASMMVRERRDTSGANNGLFPVSGVTPAECTAPAPSPTPSPTPTNPYRDNAAPGVCHTTHWDGYHCH
ncbi:TadE/TadG family type IV pilus assembly protein [Citromicrobium sp. JLT1363]|uniref:TadE/TadG family type IV pilus assembly protein n=1 Tax=Citromicrobium sp. JLT1363 TaxID=517722 RepID=UPI000225E7A5|nr:TadE family protein [Citromicrobium sp. JLT1363]